MSDVKRKVDTFHFMERLGLQKEYGVKYREFLPPKRIGSMEWMKVRRYAASVYRPRKKIYTAVREDVLPGSGQPSAFLRCWAALTPDNIWSHVLACWRKNHAALVSESPQCGWSAQGVIRLTHTRLTVEIDEHPERMRICKYYDMGPLYSYSGDWSYKGSAYRPVRHKAIVHKLMEIICVNDLFGYFIEWTKFNQRGLILWQFRDKDTPEVPRLGPI